MEINYLVFRGLKKGIFMRVFISYCHSDKEFVDKLAINLVKSNIPIWLDRWELKVGDSITQKIQEMLSESDYLLMVFSKQSIESDWVKREMTVGLLREVEEKRAIILPILIEDCKLPLFIRDKFYADFRANFNSGFKQIEDTLATHFSQNQFHINTKDYETDWSIEWKEDNINKTIIVELDTISYHKYDKYSVLFSLSIIGNETALKRYKLFHKENLGWFYKNVLLFTVVDYINTQGSKILLENSFSKYLNGIFKDYKNNFELYYQIRCKWLGSDVGNDILFDFGNMLNTSIEHLKDIESNIDIKTQNKIKELLNIIIE